MSSTRIVGIAVIALAIVSGCSSDGEAERTSAPGATATHSARWHATLDDGVTAFTHHQLAIQYHGGPVVLGTPNIYFVWYGNWSGNSATTILTDWANGIGGSAYYGINTTYFDGAGRHVSDAARFGGATTDAYSQGTTLSDAQIEAVVFAAINSGKLPKDTNGVYFVLTSADVNESSGFCTQYCGWHANGAMSDGTNILYSFVGNPDRCPSACAAQTISPNGNTGADAMASILSHEFEETTSDPNGNAWYDSRGNENADKCAWTFGTESTLPSGAKYNTSFGGRNWLIQQNWVNAGSGYCAMHL